MEYNTTDGLNNLKELSTTTNLKHDLEDIFFVQTNGNYGSVREGISAKVKRSYGLDRGTLCGIRYRSKDGLWGEWRLQVYWTQIGVRSKILGTLPDVWQRIH